MAVNGLKKIKATPCLFLVNAAKIAVAWVKNNHFVYIDVILSEYYVFNLIVLMSLLFK